MDNGFVVKPPDDSLSKSGYSYDGAVITPMIYYMNVVVRSDNAEAVAKNNGQWCLKGDILLEAPNITEQWTATASKSKSRKKAERPRKLR